MNTHHVCFSSSLACSGANPCRLCLNVITENVLPTAMAQARITEEQALLFFQGYEEGWRRLHAQMMQDPAVQESSLDLSRVTIGPTTAEVAHAAAQAFPSPQQQQFAPPQQQAFAPPQQAFAPPQQQAFAPSQQQAFDPSQQQPAASGLVDPQLLAAANPAVMAEFMARMFGPGAPPVDPRLAAVMAGDPNAIAEFLATMDPQLVAHLRQAAEAGQPPPVIEVQGVALPDVAAVADAALATPATAAAPAIATTPEPATAAALVTAPISDVAAAPDAASLKSIRADRDAEEVRRLQAMTKPMDAEEVAAAAAPANVVLGSVRINGVPEEGDRPSPLLDVSEKG